MRTFRSLLIVAAILIVSACGTIDDERVSADSGPMSPPTLPPPDDIRPLDLTTTSTTTTTEVEVEVEGETDEADWGISATSSSLPPTVPPATEPPPPSTTVPVTTPTTTTTTTTTEPCQEPEVAWHGAEDDWVAAHGYVTEVLDWPSEGGHSIFVPHDRPATLGATNHETGEVIYVTTVEMCDSTYGVVGHEVIQESSENS